MGALEGRINELEKESEQRKPVFLLVIHRSPGEPEPTEAEIEAAKEAYKREHPGWEEKNYNIICVISKVPRPEYHEQG